MTKEEIEGLEKENEKIKKENEELKEISSFYVYLKGQFTDQRCYVEQEKYMIIRQYITEDKFIVPKFYHNMYESLLQEFRVLEAGYEKLKKENEEINTEKSRIHKNNNCINESYQEIFRRENLDSCKVTTILFLYEEERKRCESLRYEIEKLKKENEKLNKRLKHLNKFGEFIECEMPPTLIYPNVKINNNFLVNEKGYDFIKKLQYEIEELKKNKSSQSNFKHLEVHAHHGIDDENKVFCGIDTWYTRNGKEVIVIDKALGNKIPNGDFEIKTGMGYYKVCEDLYIEFKSFNDMLDKYKKQIDVLNKRIEYLNKFF
jgi:FtsZ-binding cell division protein ZapB